MQTSLVEGTSVPNYDYPLLQQLASQERDERVGVMRLAIRNSDGEIYRVIELDGIAAWNRVTSVLADLGLQDDLDCRPARLGYDAVFTPPDQRVEF